MIDKRIKEGCDHGSKDGTVHSGERQRIINTSIPPTQVMVEPPPYLVRQLFKGSRFSSRHKFSCSLSRSRALVDSFTTMLVKMLSEQISDPLNISG